MRAEFTLGLARHALRAGLGGETYTITAADDEKTRPAVPGLYVHADGTDDDAPVLYIGQAKSIAKRLSTEFKLAANYRAGLAADWNQWQSAEAAIGPVLAAAAHPVALVWPTPTVDEARIWELVLIRCSAINGATPPAQGGGWDWSVVNTATTHRAYEHLTRLFNEQGFGARLAGPAAEAGKP